MKTIITTMLVFILASMSHAAQSLTVNGSPDNSITIELGTSCTFEVFSGDSSAYVVYLGFDDGLVLGEFTHIETKPEAGDLASVIEYDQPTFYGYYLTASGISPPPSAGVHFVFHYEAQELGQTDLKLYDSTLTNVMDSIHIDAVSAPINSAFTYQGRLIDNNSPADGLYDLEFKLYDVYQEGIQMGSTVDVNEIDVMDGYFTVELDFGFCVFDGNDRWLQIGVRPGELDDPNDYTTLMPRQQLTPTPHAIYAEKAGRALSGIKSSGTAGYITKFEDTNTLTDSVIYEFAGSVGIGTTEPDEKLEVDGNIKADNFIGDGTQLTGLQPKHTGAIYRWNVFDTYCNNLGWMMGNDASMYGGVMPSSWTDGSAMAGNMSSDKEVLRTLFTRKGYAGKNANIVSEVFHQYSSTTGKVAVALFRIRNNTAFTIGWTPHFRYTCYSGWGERASVALNGSTVWHSGGTDSGVNNQGSVTLSIPPQRTSTVIFVSTSNQATSIGSNISVRSTILAFIDNSLELPAGLEYVDDLDTATGDWEQ